MLPCWPAWSVTFFPPALGGLPGCLVPASFPALPGPEPLSTCATAVLPHGAACAPTRHGQVSKLAPWAGALTVQWLHIAPRVRFLPARWHPGPQSLAQPTCHRPPAPPRDSWFCCCAVLWHILPALPFPQLFRPLPGLSPPPELPSMGCPDVLPPVFSASCSYAVTTATLSDSGAGTDTWRLLWAGTTCLATSTPKQKLNCQRKLLLFVTPLPSNSEIGVLILYLILILIISNGTANM